MLLDTLRWVLFEVFLFEIERNTISEKELSPPALTVRYLQYKYWNGWLQGEKETSYSSIFQCTALLTLNSMRWTKQGKAISQRQIEAIGGRKPF